MTEQKLSPDFRQIMSAAEAGEVVIPRLRAYLWNPRFPEFTVKTAAFEKREPDGWFHPSTHPLWNERQLYTYLTHPEIVDPGPLDPLSTMYVTQGNFWHSFIQTCLLDDGYLNAVEIPVEDPEAGSRGHMDGRNDEEAWEFKTMHPAKVSKIPRGTPRTPEVLDWFKDHCADYYAQAQEYLRMTGLPLMRVLILSVVGPFEMREIEVPYDTYAAQSVRTKYLRVRQAVADNNPPIDCCGITSKEAKACPARAFCMGVR